jgi:hypothetical protein
VTTYAPEARVHRPHVNLWLVAVIALAAALVGLGAWVLIDRYGGGESAAEEATAVLDDFYAAVNTQDEAALRALFADDVVVWSNGDVMTGEDQVVGAIMTTAGLTMERLAPVTVYGDFATTYIRLAVTSLPGIDGPVVETFRLDDGQIVRAWDFVLGVTPPFDNTATPPLPAG